MNKKNLIKIFLFTLCCYFFLVVSYNSILIIKKLIYSGNNNGIVFVNKTIFLSFLIICLITI